MELRDADHQRYLQQLSKYIAQGTAKQRVRAATQAAYRRRRRSRLNVERYTMQSSRLYQTPPSTMRSQRLSPECESPGY